MDSFDEFSANLLEEAKRFLEKAIETSDIYAKDAYLHSAILIGTSALEAYINGISEDISSYPDLPLIEKSILKEKEIKFDKGEYLLSDILKIYRVTDRIEFLYFKFKKEKLNGETETWWRHLKTSLKLRNDLVHPRDFLSVSEDNVKLLIQSVIDCLLCLSKLVYRKHFPFKNLGLQSKLTF